MNNITQFDNYQNLENYEPVEFVHLITQVAEENIHDSSFDDKKLALYLNLSRSSLYRRVKSTTTQSPGELIQNIRFESARELLAVGAGNISEIAYSIGFNDPHYFARCFKMRYGMSPTEFMNKNCSGIHSVNNKASYKNINLNTFVEYLNQVIEENIHDNKLSIEKLADCSASSSSTLYRKVKSATGLSPMQLVHEIRLKKAYEFLIMRKSDMYDVAFLVGFTDLKYFSKCFRKKFGVSPSLVFKTKVNLQEVEI